MVHFPFVSPLMLGLVGSTFAVSLLVFMAFFSDLFSGSSEISLEEGSGSNIRHTLSSLNIVCN